MNTALHQLGILIGVLGSVFLSSVVDMKMKRRGWPSWKQSRFWMPIWAALAGASAYYGMWWAVAIYLTAFTTDAWACARRWP